MGNNGKFKHAMMNERNCFNLHNHYLLIISNSHKLNYQLLHIIREKENILSTGEIKN